MGADELDLINRDPNGLHSNTKVAFEDIFGEPEGSHSPKCAWKCTHCCYTGAKKICYAIFTVLCGWLCGLCWGCDFACLAFQMIYCQVPYLRQAQIVCGVLGKMYQACLDCFMTPICVTCGMCLSNIKVVQSSG